MDDSRTSGTPTETKPPDSGLTSASQGIRALQRGDRREARRWAHRALRDDPTSESGWLLLAALSPESRRGAYVHHLLRIHPDSERARQAAKTLGIGVRPAATRPAARVIEGPELRGRSPAVKAAQAAIRRIAEIGATLLLLAFLTTYGIILSERGREGLPAEPVAAVGLALDRTADFFLHHPGTYLWERVETPAVVLVGRIFGHSAGLLIVALALALVVGLGLGLAAALAGRRGGSALAVGVSILGVSTPSFLLAMLLWVLNIQVHRTFGITVLPSVGFGWDVHMIMPALVLAARPIAQLARVTHLSVSEVLGAEFVRAARARGLAGIRLYVGHILRLAWMPVLTTLGSSLRFSLSSLPVVELFFDWPGVGRALVDALNFNLAPLVVDLILSLGVFFLLVNLALDLVYPWLDPRLRQEGTEDRKERGETVRDLLRWALRDVSAMWTQLRERFRPAPRLAKLERVLPAARGEDPGLAGRRRRAARSVLTNLPLLAGGLLVTMILLTAVTGQRWTEASPYQTHGVMMILGKIGSPPYAPSEVFPWGTDHLGRDMQALVLSGARQTLTLAFFAMLARLLLGGVLGMLAGWTENSWLDRTIRSGIGIWAAFPGTLLAMILIQALGIQQGLWVFVAALCIVGWAEVAQVVRVDVLAIKAEPYIEAARSVGLHALEILRRHVFPNLVGKLVVLAMLEMGGVLMLLAELGYLNIFLGGGFRAMIAEGGAMVPIIAHFSDVPEWGALLANIRDWWRSNPWMAWYPGIAFCLAILGFNLFSEGLRRFLQSGFVNLSRVINRYTALAVLGAAVVLGLLLQASSPLSTYQAEAERFDTERALAHVQLLASPDMQGRETGRTGAALAAEYIALQMEAIGLQPAGYRQSYFQVYPNPRPHLDELPELTLLDAGGSLLRTFLYHHDFAERTPDVANIGEAEGPVVGLTLGPLPADTGRDPYGLLRADLVDKIVLVRSSDLSNVNSAAVAGVLVVADSPADVTRRYLMSSHPLLNFVARPTMVVTREAADAFLRSAGTSLEAWEEEGVGLQPGEAHRTEAGARVRLQIPVTMAENPNAEPYINVIGFIPGTGAETGLDSQVVMVAAYYDGTGVSPDGTLYPGANDNASGVAALLETARILNDSPFAPERTVVFVAWAGGDRSEGLSVDNIMNAHPGFGLLNVEAVLELGGLGQGTGQGLAFDEYSSYRLVKLFQSAAARLGVPTTTRGRGPHYGLPILPGFGERPGLSLFLSWNGADATAHTPEDTFAALDPNKLRQAGETALLSLFVLSRETEY